MPDEISVSHPDIGPPMHEMASAGPGVTVEWALGGWHGLC